MIELAIVRDMEKRLFTENRRYTLGVYCLGLTWRFYVLQDSESDAFKYTPHHVYTHRLTKSYLSWLQLGVILQRLAAYNLLCTRRLQLISKEAQAELIDDIERLAVKADMDCDAKRKRQRQKSDHTKKQNEDKKDKEDDGGDDKGGEQKSKPLQQSKHNSAATSSATNASSSRTSKSNTNNTNRKEKHRQISATEVDSVVITHEIYSVSCNN